MTEEERQKLEDTHRMSKAIHDALMKDGVAGEPPLINRMTGVVLLVERSNWAAKWGWRGFLSLGVIAATLTAIKTGLTK